MAQCPGILLVLLWVWPPHRMASILYEDDSPPTIDYIIQLPEVEDGECVFPFWYKNKIFYDCIKLSVRHYWCSLNKTFQGYWKYCTTPDFAPCVFPFWYRRMIYWECTNDGEDFGRKWCSLTKNYNKDQVWKYC